jgi:protein-S-isoprenylcysteine O-methyltransferase Ste14
MASRHRAPVEGGARVRLPPPLAFVGFALAGVGLRYAVAPLQVPLELTIRLAIGLLVQLVALVLVGSARWLFFRTKQKPAPWTPSPELILVGPYRCTRNPMYVGVTLFQVGLGVTLDNLWISLLALPALVAVHFAAVLPEERYLAEKFGEPYLRYAARVRRYI